MGKIMKFKKLLNSIKIVEKEIKSINTEVNCIMSKLNMSQMNLRFS